MSRRTPTPRAPYHSGKAAHQAFAAQARLYMDRWFKAPALPLMTTAARNARAFPGSYAWAKQEAQETAAQWMDRELHRPGNSQDHGTVRIAGKPYHWRQDYTGQLKLAAGESPW